MGTTSLQVTPVFGACLPGMPGVRLGGTGWTECSLKRPWGKPTLVWVEDSEEFRATDQDHLTHVGGLPTRDVVPHPRAPCGDENHGVQQSSSPSPHTHTEHTHSQSTHSTHRAYTQRPWCLIQSTYRAHIQSTHTAHIHRAQTHTQHTQHTNTDTHTHRAQIHTVHTWSTHAAHTHSTLHELFHIPRLHVTVRSSFRSTSWMEGEAGTSWPEDAPLPPLPRAPATHCLLGQAWSGEME